MKKHKRIIAWSVVACAAAALMLAALRETPVPVEIGRAAPTDLELTVAGRGRVVMETRHPIAAPVSGFCRKLPFRAGDDVAAGELVAVLEAAASPILDRRSRAELAARLGAAVAHRDEADVAVARARVLHERATLELARVSALAAAGAVTQKERDDAALDAELARKDLEAARLAGARAESDVAGVRALLSPGRPTSAARGDRTVEVRAPAGGRVLRVFLVGGGPVETGTPLLEIGDPSSIHAVLELPTTEAVRVDAGDAARIFGWGRDQVLAGTVRLVEPSAFTKVTSLGIEEQRVNVLIDPAGGDFSAWSALGDGFHVEAAVVLDRRIGVLAIPAGALMRGPEGWFTFVVDRDHARKQAIEVGDRNEREVEVADGLAAGARVIVYPSDRIEDGVLVAAR